MVDEENAHREKGRKAGLEAARNAFYRGDITQAIVTFQKRNGGFLSAEDMAEFHAGIEPPVQTSFAGVDVYACGPWCQGPSLLQALNILQNDNLTALGHNSAAYSRSTRYSPQNTLSGAVR